MRGGQVPSPNLAELAAAHHDVDGLGESKSMLLKLALHGRHQLENAAVAVAILERWSMLVRHLPTEAIVTGLTRCEWPGRLEWLHVPVEGGTSGDLLIDAAHNPAGAAALGSPPGAPGALSKKP